MKGLTHKQLKIQSESSICVRTVPIAGIGQQNPYEPVCQPTTHTHEHEHEHTHARTGDERSQPHVQHD